MFPSLSHPTVGVGEVSKWLCVFLAAGCGQPIIQLEKFPTGKCYSGISQSKIFQVIQVT